MMDRAQPTARGGILKHVAAAFVIAAVFYFVAYHGVEYLRQRKGGWQVTFAVDSQGRPRLEVAQPRLGISDVTFLFPHERVAQTNQETRIVFDRPVTNVPFGRVIYLDTTFLPGAVVFDFFGNEIQLLPRVLMVNREELPWQSARTYRLSGPP